MKTSKVAELVVRLRNHWNLEGTHAPYQGMIHDVDSDTFVGQIPRFLRESLEDSGVADGQAFRIVIEPIGDVDTAGRWQRVGNGRYEWVAFDSQVGAT